MFDTYTVSRLWFTLPPSKSMNGDDTEEINGTGADEDGDLMLRRKTSKCKETGDMQECSNNRYMFKV